MLAPISSVGLACVSDSPATSTGVRDTLPDGTIVVRYDGLPDVGVPLERDLAIGVPEGDPNLIFGDVRGIEAGGDGTIYVLDYQAAEVRAFDSEGRFLRTVVRRGKGPGEIAAANGMVLVGDSALWIQDHGQWMNIAVDLDGEELARVPMHVLSFSYVWNGAIDEQGRFWKPTSHSEEPRVFPPPLGLAEGHSRSYFKSYDRLTRASDSIYVGEDTYRTFVSRNDRGGHSYRSVPYHPRRIVIVDPAGGFWETLGADYRIARLDERGDTTLVIDVQEKPNPVTAQDRDQYVRNLVEGSPNQRQREFLQAPAVRW